MTTATTQINRSARPPQGWLTVACFAAVAALAYGGILEEMARDWSRDDNYSHGFLVPFVAAYFLWRRRERLAGLEARPAWSGLLPLLIGLAGLVVGEIGAEQFTKRLSLLVVLGGGIAFLAGWRWLREVAFPYAYLLFMVPLPYILYDAVAFPLKLFAARFATTVVADLGIPIYAEGNVIYLESTTLQVADACSGIRSLMSLLALAAAFAYLTQRPGWRRWVLFLSAIPIAIATNMARIVGTAVLADQYGAKVAMGFFHEFAGLVVFGTALVLLFVAGVLLGRIGRGTAGRQG